MEPEFCFPSGPKKRKTDSICDFICVFCNLPFTEKDAAITGDISKLENLFTSCERRNDSVGKLILQNKQNISSGDIPLKYHKKCRSTYCSPHHLDRLKPEHLQIKASYTKEANHTQTRSKTGESEFNWKEYCFICSERCSQKHRSTWSMVESAIGNVRGENIYTKVLSAAHKRRDYSMLTRLSGVPNGDLVAVEARYHRRKGCYVRYISERHINATLSQDRKRKTDQKDIVKQLIEEFRDQIVENRQIFLLSTLKSRFQTLCNENGIENTLINSRTSSRLKELIQQETNEFSFLYQQGLSDMVCSSEITVREALLKVNEFLKKEDEFKLDGGDGQRESFRKTSEESIVHSAIGILRERLGKTQRCNDQYYASTDIYKDRLVDFVDPLLLKALVWLTNDTIFNEAGDVHTTTFEDIKCLNIACDITTLVTSVMSPKHLGLAIHLHHQFGSRKLIEHMHSLGYCISYTELRHFLTSASIYVGSARRTKSGLAIPPQLTPKEKGGLPVIGVGDNWDHNEKTVDGRGTTHAMTSILVTPNVCGEITFPSIPRTSMRTLDTSLLQGGNLSLVTHYKKPTKRPEPIITPTPTLEELTDLSNAEEMKSARMTEMLYHLLRSGEFDECCESPVPVWKQFHSLIQSDTTKVSTVAFNQILMSPPNDLSTIYTTLLRMKEISHELGHNSIPVCFDMGILTKALEIVWSKPDELSGVYLMEGGMHFLMSVFSGIGYIYGDAGLRSLLSESGVFAAGTTHQILLGKDFDRALYALHLVDEVLNIRFLKQFKTWCYENNIVIPGEVFEGLTACKGALQSDAIEPGDLANVFANGSASVSDHLVKLLDEFREKGRSESPTFQFWDDFLTAILLPLKVFIAATRHANWTTYQGAKADLLPLLFASNRTNYARYMPVLLFLLQRIPQSVKEAFNQGQFVAKLSEGKFNNVWMDYTLETTENKALKGNGGVIGLTMKGSSLARWFLSRPVTALYSTNFTAMIQGNKVPATASRKAEANRWDSDVRKMNNMFDGVFADPFNLTDPPPNLINFATGAVAEPNVQNSLLGVIAKGSEMSRKFVDERLVPDSEGAVNKSLYDSLSRSNIKTMSEMNRTVHIRDKNVFINGEAMYLRLLAINSLKQVPLQRVLSFENSAVPLSLFADDGTANSCAKSELLHKVESLLENEKITTLEVTNAAALVFDGHAIIQMLPGPTCTQSLTFSDMARQFWAYILRLCTQHGQIQQIHVAFDRYDKNSIKQQTRKRRGGRTQTSVEYHVQLNVQAPKNWKLFLSLSENKQNLARCYIEYIKRNYGNLLKDDQAIYITNGNPDDTVVIKTHGFEPYMSLVSNHEEADTRLVLHSVVASEEGAKTVIVKSPDTDVFVLLLHHRVSIKSAEIYFLTGQVGKHASLQRYIPVHDLYNILQMDQLNVLMPIYCLTGCDTVSSFYGYGKRAAFRLIMQKANSFQGLKTLGLGSELSEIERKAVTLFVGELYGKKNCTSLDKLRCEKAAQQKTPRKLPPTENSLHQHALRAKYQLLIWERADIPIIPYENPEEFGYEKDDLGSLRPCLMTQPPAPPELLNDLVCFCPSSSCVNDCTCRENGQPCTAACKCEARLPLEDMDDMCTNPLTLLSLCEYMSDDDDDDDDDEQREKEC